MFSKEIQFRKKRELGDVISDSFLFLKQEFRPLLKIVLIYVAPFLILYSVGQVFIQQKLVQTVIPADPETMIAAMIPVYKNLFFLLLFNVFVQSLYIGVVYSYIKVYIARGKGNFSTSDVVPLLFHNSLFALGANLLLTIIILFGIIMCILPGIFLANTFSLAIICLIIEKRGLGNALSKSWSLVNSQWWSTLLINIIGLVILWVIGFILSLPSMLAGFTVRLINIGQMEQVDLPQWYWVATGISTFIASLCYIILFTFWVFQYFNLEERVNPTSLPPAEI